MSLGFQITVGIIWLRLWYGSVAALHFDWSIGNHLNNQNGEVPKVVHQSEFPNYNSSLECTLEMELLYSRLGILKTLKNHVNPVVYSGT